MEEINFPNAVNFMPGNHDIMMFKKHKIVYTVKTADNIERITLIKYLIIKNNNKFTFLQEKTDKSTSKNCFLSQKYK